MAVNDSAKAWGAFACVAFFWGTTYLAIGVGIKSFPPMLFASLRHLIAGSLILTYFFIRKYPLPPKDQFKHIIIMSLLMLGIGNGLLVWAQQFVSSGLTAIISATFPFAVFFFSWALGQSKPNAKVITGILLGFVGQLFIFYEKLDLLKSEDFRWSLLAMFIAIVCWGYGAVYRKTATITLHSLQFSGWQMVTAGLFLLPFAFFSGEFSKLNVVSSEALWALAYLIIFGSIVAYGCFMYVLNKLPATTVSMYSHINTIVAVFLGWYFLNEQLTFKIAISAVLTLVGVYLVNSGINTTKKPQ